MSHIPRTPRAVAQRQALGRRLRAHRLALGLTTKDIAAHIGCGTYQVSSIETVCRDVLTGTLIDVAAAVGLEVGLVASYHLPLLDLTAHETDVLILAAKAYANTSKAPTLAALRSALDKLTKENTDA